ncbi:hypothetical protein DESC_870030 [Desulfosarcina cetonica]|nr:hypothetical protein DESC_870030 [Desulfosarcina cetonica]
MRQPPRLQLLGRYSRNGVLALPLSPVLLLGFHSLTGIGDRIHDLVVSGTAAQVAGNGMPDLGFIGLKVVFEQVQGGQLHAGGTESALDGTLFDEGLLDGVERLPGRRKTLHGENLLAVGFHGQGEAGTDALAVDHDRAGTAVTRTAAQLGSRQVQVFAKDLVEGPPWLDVKVIGVAINL